MRYSTSHIRMCMFLGGICLLVGASLTQQADAQYMLVNNVFSNGSAALSNTQYHMNGTLGQPMIGSSTGGGTTPYTTTIGFWYTQQSIVTGIGSGPELPTEFRLEQNYPNPFNPSSDIRYQIPEFRTVRLGVYDILGREVAVLVNEAKPPGAYIVRFDAGGLASGVYLYRLTAGWFVETKNMVVVK